MSATIERNGTANATVPPDSSAKCGYASESITSLQQLLELLQPTPPASFPMLKSTVARLVDFYGRSPDSVMISTVEADKREFRDYLQQRRYSRNSTRSYVNYSNILIRLARENGWRPSGQAIPEEWSRLLPERGRKDYYDLIRFLVKHGRAPEEVVEHDFSQWIELRVKRRRSYANARRIAGSLRKLLVISGTNALLATSNAKKACYGTPLELLPEPLQSEVRDILRWKHDPFVPERLQKDRVRSVTAQTIEKTFGRVFGFARNVQRHSNICRTSDLVNKDVITAFIAWSLNERGVKGRGLKTSLGLLGAALSQNPKYRHITGSWLTPLLNTIPGEDESEAIRRKEERFVPYERIRAISQSINEDRATSRNDTAGELAKLVRDQLLILWLAVLPWRQRNIRECRVHGQRPNLFKGKTSALVGLTKPEWLVAAEKINPDVEAWQFRFSPDETKTHHAIHCILPKMLVELLEEYISKYRRDLVRGSDPGTLFLNNDGHALTTGTLRNHVMRLTLRYAGRAVNPHLFRDIFAYMWLERCPEDYLTLSKLLWHRNINTTIRIYGRRFNESTALCRMERVLGD